jgi:hypothetical protein
MNAENFYEYLKNPTRLYQVTYQELRGLMLQYPFSPNIRFLMLAKSKLDKLNDEEKNLNLAALHVPDRNMLRKQLKKLEEHLVKSDYPVLEEEILELRDLSEWQVQTEADKQELSTLREQSVHESSTLREVSLQVEPIFSKIAPVEAHKATSISDDSETTQTNFDPDEVRLRNMLVAEIVNKAVSISAFLPTITNKVRTLPNEVINPETKPSTTNETSPDPKSNFNSWLKQFQPPQLELPSKNLKEVTQKKQEEEYFEPEDVAKELASKSILEDTEIVSLSLAALMEGQGHIEKAIAMYKKLSLQYPEKSSFFAAKIEKLKNM